MSLSKINSKRDSNLSSSYAATYNSNKQQIWQRDSYRKPKNLENCFEKNRNETVGNSISHSVTTYPERTPLTFQEKEQISDFKTFDRRLWTFRRFPRTCPMSPNELAKVGFIYIGPDDRVKCVFCFGIIHRWKAGDSPLGEHLRLFPTCQFAQTISIELGLNGFQIEPNVNNILIVAEEYSSVESRMQTFSDYLWPACISQKPDELSVAGFYYLGEADFVHCFSCGGILRNWQPEDIPWEEHARWFPKCKYLEDNKGRAFIMQVQTKYQNKKAGHHPKVLQLEQNAVTRRRPTNSAPVGANRIKDEDIHYEKAVRVALSCGYSSELIGEAIDKLEQSFKKSSSTASSKAVVSPTTLLDVIFNIEESKKSLKSSERSFSKLTSNIAEDEKVLEMETYRLRQDKLCKICFSLERNVLLLPCKHLVCCTNCSSRLRSCPICRTKVNGTIRTFMS